MTDEFDDLLVAIAAAGLPGSLHEFLEDPVPEPQARELVRAAERLGMAGLMLVAVQRGGLSLPPSASAALDEAQLYESTSRLYLEQELLTVGGVLDDAEIEFRVLEGCAVAHLDYRDPDVRSVMRLDLLVRPRTLGRAAEVLSRRNWRPPKVPDGGSDRGMALVGPSGPRLVLHDDVDGVRGLAVKPAELWTDGDPFSVSGRKFKALGSEQRLLYTATLALDQDDASSLLPQRDLVEMILFGEWHRVRLMELAVSWNAQGVLASAVDTAWHRLAIADVTALSVWAGGYRPEERRNARRYSVGGPNQTGRDRSWRRLRNRPARRS